MNKDLLHRAVDSLAGNITSFTFGEQTVEGLSVYGMAKYDMQTAIVKMLEGADIVRVLNSIKPKQKNNTWKFDIFPCETDIFLGFHLDIDVNYIQSIEIIKSLPKAGSGIHENNYEEDERIYLTPSSHCAFPIYWLEEKFCKYRISIKLINNNPMNKPSVTLDSLVIDRNKYLQNLDSVEDDQEVNTQENN